MIFNIFTICANKLNERMTAIFSSFPNKLKPYNLVNVNEMHANLNLYRDHSTLQLVVFTKA